MADDMMALLHIYCKAYTIKAKGVFSFLHTNDIHFFSFCEFGRWCHFVELRFVVFLLNDMFQTFVRY